MLFINWWMVGETALAIFMIAVGVIGFRRAGKLHRGLARFGIRLMSVPLAGVGTLFGLLLFTTYASGCESVSAPIYSPSGQRAVRIYDIDEGATGGSTSVDVYWARGFQRANVFSGPWKAVESTDIHWISDSELRIDYHADEPADDFHCGGAAGVKIVCIRK